jgi:hypothetical protein
MGDTNNFRFEVCYTFAFLFTCNIIISLLLSLNVEAMHHRFLYTSYIHYIIGFAFFFKRMYACIRTKSKSSVAISEIIFSAHAGSVKICINE